MGVGLDQFTLDAEPFLDTGNRGFAIPALWVDIAGGDAQRVQVTGGIRPAVVGLQNDQRILETYFCINERQQLSERAIEPEEVVLGLEARRAEDVPHVVGR